ncbi:hypothetical protein EMIHUDRAFT_233175 [Emiliania huxleyi CCMP1516]|uniref:Uncharacterized protein n=2 Tax=Emiliania huxleyi TaxID=2903 RepID=A0A0D3K374_EMIH1|nr:hypothetical protein EMIHUDRAFT_233175 [Emiliania huxleyi CCMP1516]EOD30209.1 hypothetical protein EMIHUDRAFT_233175 [Emiliania huxleyi CCMP1516]|eukprot:XP_005782638.1 hypothetical protein EMIHUDRAFT_233175 [Emiliania huxleyi CCMP1516]
MRSGRAREPRRAQPQQGSAGKSKGAPRAKDVFLSAKALSLHDGPVPQSSKCHDDTASDMAAPSVASSAATAATAQVQLNLSAAAQADGSVVHRHAGVTVVTDAKGLDVITVWADRSPGARPRSSFELLPDVKLGLRVPADLRGFLGLRAFATSEEVRAHLMHSIEKAGLTSPNDALSEAVALSGWLKALWCRANNLAPAWGEIVDHVLEAKPTLAEDPDRLAIELRSGWQKLPLPKSLQRRLRSNPPPPPPDVSDCATLSGAPLRIGLKEVLSLLAARLEAAHELDGRACPGLPPLIEVSSQQRNHVGRGRGRVGARHGWVHVEGAFPGLPLDEVCSILSKACSCSVTPRPAKYEGEVALILAAVPPADEQAVDALVGAGMARAYILRHPPELPPTPGQRGGRGERRASRRTGNWAPADRAGERGQQEAEEEEKAHAGGTAEPEPVEEGHGCSDGFADASHDKGGAKRGPDLCCGMAGDDFSAFV